MAPLMETYGLTEDNFSMGYYNTATGESWYYNGGTPMVGGSVYKLPLNMLYEEKLNAGELSPDDLVGGYTVEKAMYFSLVESNNDVSAALEEALGTHDQFRALIARYFGVESGGLPREFVEGNNFSAEYTIRMLRYLYDNGEDYPRVLSLLKQAQPGKYFRAGVTEYEVAQKYGYYEGYLDDAAVIYTPRPFLLAVFTCGVREEVLGDIAAAMTAYTLAADETAAAEESARTGAEGAAEAGAPLAAETILPSPSPAPSLAPAVSPAPAGSADGARGRLWVIGAGAAAAAVLAALRAAKKRRTR